MSWLLTSSGQLHWQHHSQEYLHTWTGNEIIWRYHFIKSNIQTLCAAASGRTPMLCSSLENWFLPKKFIFSLQISCPARNKAVDILLTVVVDLEELLSPLKRMNFNLYKVWWWWEDRLGSGGQQWAGHSLLILWLHFVGLVLDQCWGFWSV